LSSEWNALNVSSAVNDFRDARRHAALERILARLTGNSAELLSYDAVRKKLKTQGRVSRGVQDVPLDKIIGSVDRYEDFTRKFTPLQDSDESRWARVEVAVSSAAGLPPVDLYQIGDAYFVLDGNHRVSVARQLGATHIQAHVIEIQTRVPLAADDTPSDLILKAEYAEFLASTRLDKLRPKADLTVSAPGSYPMLIEHINVHRYFMGIERRRSISYEDAVIDWYDKVYLPVVQIIRERGVLRQFPGRTETDLYLWLSQHRAELQYRLGWDIQTDEAVADLVERASPRLKRVLRRCVRRTIGRLLPRALDSGPPPGQWKQEFNAVHRQDALFGHILVPIREDEAGWDALRQAAEVARRENGVLRGLKVIASEDERENAHSRALQARFNELVAELEVSGELALEVGKVSRTTCRRARWTDLVVLSLVHPPALRPLSRLGSGFRRMVQHCPTPILAVRGEISPLRKALVAYNGSAKADEALYVATYLACRWAVSLVVMTASEHAQSGADVAARASSYLDEHGVRARFVERNEPAPTAILDSATQYDCDFIIMGGYGFSPVLQIALGSAVDHVLLGTEIPVLICR